jgi:hypothetical protein
MRPDGRGRVHSEPGPDQNTAPTALQAYSTAPAADPDQAARFVDALWSDDLGWACLATLAEGRWREHFYRWPAERDDLLSHALRAAERADVYVAPALRSQRRRTKDTAIPGPWAWADVDVVGDAARVRLVLLGPMVVASGSPRSFHVYVRLAEAPEDIEELEVWNRRLARFLEADAKHDASAVLRLPGTLNRKAPTLPRPVHLERLAGAPWSLADLAARITIGKAMPDGSGGGDPGAVVLVSAEDGLADTVRPRLELAGADLALVTVVEHLELPDGRTVPLELPGDLEALEAVVRDVRARLVTIDPLMAFLAGSVNASRDQDVRRALHPVTELAERTGAAFLVVRHLRKAATETAVQRGGGSIGIIGAARVGLMVAPDPADSDRRILAVTKSNLGPIPPAMAYRLLPDDPLGVAAVVWEGQTDHRADDLLGAPVDRPAPKRAAAPRAAGRRAPTAFRDRGGGRGGRGVVADGRDGEGGPRRVERAAPRAGQAGKRGGVVAPPRRRRRLTLRPTTTNPPTVPYPKPQVASNGPQPQVALNGPQRGLADHSGGGSRRSTPLRAMVRKVRNV